MPLGGRSVLQSTVILLTLGLLTLVGIVVTTTWLVERARVHFREVIEARDLKAATVELGNALLTAESSERGFIATGNEIYLAPYARAKTQVLQRMAQVSQLAADDPAGATRVTKLRALTLEKIAEMDRTVELKSHNSDAEALVIVRTNRGKALMDEANIFLSGILLAADERLNASVAEQRTNATLLRWLSILGGTVIVLIVAGVGIMVLRYAREIVRARDEVSALNAGLEMRVEERTAALARARDRAELLVDEVNHRVANSLSLVASLAKLQSNALKDPAARSALGEMHARINAIASVHKRLYSSGDVRSVALNEYLAGLLDQFAGAMQAEQHGTTLRYDLEPMKLSTDSSINLGVVVTELVTNAFKYAYPSEPGEVRVRVKRLADGRGELLVEDDGVGRAGGSPKGTGLGTRIVNAIATTMGAEIHYRSHGRGTAAQLIFPMPTLVGSC